MEFMALRPIHLLDYHGMPEDSDKAIFLFQSVGNLMLCLLEVATAAAFLAFKSLIYV